MLKRNVLSALVAVGVLIAAPAHADDGAASQRVIADQIDAFKSGDHERAFSHAAPGIRSAFGSPDNFVGMVKRGYMPVFDPQQFSFGRYSERGGTLYQEVLVTGPQGKEWVALYTLRRHPDGSLRITGVRIAKSDGFAV